MAIDLIINFEDARERSNLFESMRRLKGVQRISICQHRPRRSDRQNRFYWPCIVQPWGDYLREQGNDFTDEMAHETLKKMFLEKTVIDKTTGAILTYVQSTTELDTVEFSTYVDKCIAFLADYGITVEAADPNYGRTAPEKETHEQL